MNNCKILLNLYDDISKLVPQKFDTVVKNRLNAVLYNYIDDIDTSYDFIKSANLVDIIRGMMTVGAGFNHRSN